MKIAQTRSPISSIEHDEIEGAIQMVSLKTLAKELDASKTSIRRWLDAAGINPVVVGGGRNGSLRYLRNEVDKWLRALERLV